MSELDQRLKCECGHVAAAHHRDGPGTCVVCKCEEFKTDDWRKNLRVPPYSEAEELTLP